MIRIGTSGFSYKDWVGPVYPAGLPERDWLSFYAREFSTVELNVTFYRIPVQRTVAGWVDKTPARGIGRVAHRGRVPRCGLGQARRL
jgi:uncharacterized protein YecE (DUF72 family)